MSAAPDAGGAAGAAGAAAAAEPPALWPGKGWFWWPWPILVGLDLWSKAWAFGFLAEQYPNVPEPYRHHLVWDGALRFELVAWGNPGTVWGLFPNSTVPLMVLRCVAVVGLFWFARQTARAARLQQLVLSLILAGAIGNLYDNFFRADRTVRDFLRFEGTWPTAWGFPAFNVADSCITVGAITLFVLLWREDRRVARSKAAADRPVA